MGQMNLSMKAVSEGTIVNNRAVTKSQAEKYNSFYFVDSIYFDSLSRKIVSFNKGYILFIEGVGSNKGPYWNHNEMVEPSELICMKKDDSLVYNSSSLNDCNIQWTGISIKNSDLNFSISPNPSSGENIYLEINSQREGLAFS